VRERGESQNTIDSHGQSAISLFMTPAVKRGTRLICDAVGVPLATDVGAVEDDRQKSTCPLIAARPLADVRVSQLDHNRA
jgi:hypothetical protein